MDQLLNIVIYFVGGGFVFFVGAILVLLGLATSAFASTRPRKFARNLIVMVGGILVAISATPLDWWLYGLLLVFTLVWLPLEWYPDALSKRTIVTVRSAVASVWILTLAVELPYQFTPRMPALENATLYVIGDSVSAGVSDAEKETWAKIVARDHAIDVRNLSKMGATVGSALKQADAISPEGGLVLLEIGGNDVLGSTTADEFEDHLDRLLAEVCRRDRTVVMIELPLPPFANRFGMIQRRLVRKYSVLLIPRRVFIDVLTSPGATLDGIHLTPRGHGLMAEAMWGVVGPAFTLP